MDVCGPASTAVQLIVSSNVLSARTIKVGRDNRSPYDAENVVDALCSVAPPPDYAWVDEGVIVELWSGLNATGFKIGTLGYGHLRSRVANRVHNTPADGRVTLGVLGDRNPAIDCYDGFHVHVERYSGNGMNYYRPCRTAVGTGNILYYYWW